MPARNPSAAYKLRNLATIICRYNRSSSTGHRYLGQSHGNWMSRHGSYGSYMNQGHRLFGSNSADQYRQHEINNMLKEDNINKVQVQAPVPPPPEASIFNWGKWIVGSVLALLLPFLKQKWDKLITLEGKLEKAAEEAEYVAEVVEKVAITTEKVSAEVADMLPGNGGKLKQAALMVQHISSVTISDAQLAENIIHKVGDVKQDLEELEKIVEPVIGGDKIIEAKHH